MQTENKLFEDLSKVASSAIGTLAGVGREAQDAARRRARDFVGGADSIDRDEFEAVKANAAAARETVEMLKGEVAALRAEIAALNAKGPAKA
ncbi:accessory factor UbiK family protein [Sandarakinorhabdus sp. DWP1-3-1]|uniref:accessory factor UbiK family protein n=1 Tax=Sandarakinorhabdus sp. DWP1-3-1 TaxID=2804627 RepID=UPI003CF43FDE